jgi:hypothetical protein
MPSRQSFVVEMVEQREDLGNAIALNSSMVNGGQPRGPAIAGMVIAGVGEGYCFLIDGISYIAVILSARLRLDRIEPRGSKPRRAGGGTARRLEIHHGDRQPIRSILLLLGLVSLIGMPYTVLMPIFAGRRSARRSAHAGISDGRGRRGRAHQ